MEYHSCLCVPHSPTKTHRDKHTTTLQSRPEPIPEPAGWGVVGMHPHGRGARMHPLNAVRSPEPSRLPQTLCLSSGPIAGPLPLDPWPLGLRDSGTAGFRVRGSATPGLRDSARDSWSVLRDSGTPGLRIRGADRGSCRPLLCFCLWGLMTPARSEPLDTRLNAFLKGPN